MDPYLLMVAFVLGFAARLVNLPPMVGFLVAGYILNAFDVSGGPLLSDMSDLGVTLLLFCIGLKIKVETLFKPEVWAGASIHMGGTIVVFGAIIYGLAGLGFSMFAGLDLYTSALIAFALSFSSTVFAVKVLEEKGETLAMHGRVSIGILIMQDIFAVLFITMSTDKVPSVWAFALVGFIFVRPLLFMIMDKCGHGELLPLFGLSAALVLGAQIFELVGMKADLGALLLGMLLAKHARAGKISDSLLNFKDILLVGFFLNIGLTAAFTLEAVLLAMMFVLLLPVKVALFFFLLTRFRLRARSSALASFSLATYSEFGLIVGAIGASAGWITGEWLTVIAVALSITFVIGSSLSTWAEHIYSYMAGALGRWESDIRHPEDQPIIIGDAKIAIFGMGRVGGHAYDTMFAEHGDIIIGLDIDPDRVTLQKERGRNVILGDPTDSDFWHRAEDTGVDMVVLALPELSASLETVEQLEENGYAGIIVAVVRYPDEVEILEEAGADLVVDHSAEAGVGVAAHIQRKFAEEIKGLE